MADIDGTYRLGPEDGWFLVRTGRSGVGSKAGHDLTLEVTRWDGSATIDTEHPANSSANVRVEVDSLVVREGVGGVKALTDGDRAEILRTVHERVLETAVHPTIVFHSTRVDGDAEWFAVEGKLTIMGTTRPVTVNGNVQGGRLRGSATVTQSQWGIKPYSAFFGALRLKDEVVVEFDLALPSTR